jgi:hypothetical protein
MKKLLLGSAVLTLFAISLLLFQISCQKESTAQTVSNYVLPPATTSTLGGVIVGNGLSVTSNGTVSVNPTTGGLTQLNKIVYTRTNRQVTQPQEIWTANYDGSNQTKINIVIPGQPTAYVSDPHLSPDGLTVFFQGNYQIGSVTSFNLYACNIDGSNVRKIIDGGANQWEYQMGGAY